MPGWDVCICRFWGPPHTPLPTRVRGLAISLQLRFSLGCPSSVHSAKARTIPKACLDACCPGAAASQLDVSSDAAEAGGEGELGFRYMVRYTVWTYTGQMSIKAGSIGP